MAPDSGHPARRTSPHRGREVQVGPRQGTLPSFFCCLWYGDTLCVLAGRASPRGKTSVLICSFRPYVYDRLSTLSYTPLLKNGGPCSSPSRKRDCSGCSVILGRLGKFPFHLVLRVGLGLGRELATTKVLFFDRRKRGVVCASLFRRVRRLLVLSAFFVS